MKKVANYLQENESALNDLKQKLSFLLLFRKTVNTKIRQEMIDKYKKSYPKDDSIASFLQDFNDKNSYDNNEKLNKWIVSLQTMK